MALHLGRPVARALLLPISAYFTATSRKAGSSSRRFLEFALGRSITVRDLFRHYHCFASTLLDRIYFLAGQYQRFHITTHGVEEVLARVRQGQGCMLFGSHLGSFEVARILGLAHHEVDIKVLMYEENAPMMTEVLSELNPHLGDTVIQTGSPLAMLRVKESLDAGELVAILCDRVVQKDKVVSCGFFGRDTTFPAGPVVLASIVKVPVFLFFGLYRGGNRYEIHFEHFSDRIILDRDNRTAGIHSWTQRYADRLEHYCRAAPYNWFNFYEFWPGQD